MGDNIDFAGLTKASEVCEEERGVNVKGSMSRRSSRTESRCMRRLHPFVQKPFRKSANVWPEEDEVLKKEDLQFRDLSRYHLLHATSCFVRLKIVPFKGCSLKTRGTYPSHWFCSKPSVNQVSHSKKLQSSYVFRLELLKLVCPEILIPETHVS